MKKIAFIGYGKLGRQIHALIQQKRVPLQKAIFFFDDGPLSAKGR
jgi:pyrroline-5-carboxylate reductase